MKKTLTLAALLAAFAAAHAEPATYVIDPMHTSASFEAKHFGLSTIRGRFDKKEGSVTIDRAAKTGKVQVSIDMNSISTGVPMFDGHLKGEAFFDTAKFPTTTFVGDQVSFDAAGKVTAVTGQLTLKGKTLPVTLTAISFNCIDHPMLKKEVCGGDFETLLPRSQFGVSAYPQATPENVRVLIQIGALNQ